MSPLVATYLASALNESCLLELTSASLSKRAKSSFNVLTSSGAGQRDEMAVKPTISANRMLPIATVWVRVKSGPIDLI